MAPAAFVPCAQHEDGNVEVRIDASCAFGHRVTVLSTDGEIWSVVRRLKAEDKTALVQLSNDKFRACVSADPQTLGEEGFERLCGDVLVFYCTRVVLDGCGIPCVTSQ